MYRTPEVESLRIPQQYNRRLFARAAQFANAACPLPTPPEAARPCWAAVGELFEPGFLQPWIVIVVDDAEAGRPTRTANVHPVPRHAAAGCPSHDNSRGTLPGFDDELDAGLTSYFHYCRAQQQRFSTFCCGACFPQLSARCRPAHARRAARPRCCFVGVGRKAATNSSQNAFGFATASCIRPPTGKGCPVQSRGERDSL